MHRSGSLNRSLDDFSGMLAASVSPPQAKGSSVHKSYSVVAIDLPPRYSESTDDCVKKPTRFKAEHAVHLIPVLLLLCGFVLWLGAQSGTHADITLSEHDEIVVGKKGGLIADEGLKTLSSAASGHMTSGPLENKSNANIGLLVENDFKSKEIVKDVR
eukprot:Gb_03002 [translate_table: standard]